MIAICQPANCLQLRRGMRDRSFPRDSAASLPLDKHLRLEQTLLRLRDNRN